MEHVKAVIFDWAGTVVDYGSLAPMGAFVETFAGFGVPISIDEARGPMGMAKRPHIAAIMALPRVACKWAERHGHPPSEVGHRRRLRRFRPQDHRSCGSTRKPRPRRRRGRCGNCAGWAPRSARRPATLATSWPKSCRSRAPGALRPTAWFARATRLTAVRRPTCFTDRFSTSGCGRPGTRSRSTTPRLGCRRESTPAPGRSALRSAATLFGMTQAEAAALSPPDYRAQTLGGGGEAQGRGSPLRHQQRRRSDARRAHDRRSPRARRTAMKEPATSSAEGDVNTTPLRAAWRASLSAETRDLLDQDERYLHPPVSFDTLPRRDRAREGGMAHRR